MQALADHVLMRVSTSFDFVRPGNGCTKGHSRCLQFGTDFGTGFGTCFGTGFNNSRIKPIRDYLYYDMSESFIEKRDGNDSKMVTIQK